MIDQQEIAEIRRLHAAENWPVGTIAVEVGRHHETVEKALAGQPRVRLVRPSGLDPYAEFIRETLEKHPRLRATRVFNMLRGRGYTGSVRQVRRKVAELRPRSFKEAFLRRRTFPGEEGQVDWGSFGRLRIGSTERPLCCFVIALTYSRNFYLEFFLDQVMESFLLGHDHAFRDFGGVPRVLLYDNLRSAVVARHGEAVRFNPRLFEAAAHYHFEPRACHPCRGSEKGGVERRIRDIRESFFAARTITTLERLNQEALEWRDQVAMQRRWPGDDRKTVANAFAEEKSLLLPLPEHPLDTDQVVPVRAHKTIYIRFDKNDYTIPPKAVGEPLSLVASQATVRILRGKDEITRHRRSYDRHQRIEDPAHIEALLAEKQGARASVPCARLLGAVPEAEEFLEAAFRKGESVARYTDKLLLLLDDYGAAAVRSAVQEALQKGTPRLSSVAYILGKRRRLSGRSTPLPVDLSRRPDLKDLYVKPHDPCVYDQLANPKAGGANDDNEQ